jgi:hypothetical protein
VGKWRAAGADSMVRLSWPIELRRSLSVWRPVSALHAHMTCFLRSKWSFREECYTFSSTVHLGRVIAQLGECVALDLPDSLAGISKYLTDLLQSGGGSPIEAEAHPQHGGFSLGQSFQ